MAKGDKYTVYVRGIDTGFDVEATKSGRKLELEVDKQQGTTWVFIHEKTRTDKTVSTTRFAAGDVLVITSNFEEDA